MTNDTVHPEVKKAFDKYSKAVESLEKHKKKTQDLEEKVRELEIEFNWVKQQYKEFELDARAKKAKSLLNEIEQVFNRG